MRQLDHNTLKLKTSAERELVRGAHRPMQNRKHGPAERLLARQKASKAGLRTRNVTLRRRRSHDHRASDERRD